MTKYQLKIQATFNYGNGFVEEQNEIYYSSYVAHLLRKFEDFKNTLDWNWKIVVHVYMIEKIRTMTLDEIGLHMQNDDDYHFICSFKDEGVLEP